MIDEWGEIREGRTFGSSSVMVVFGKEVNLKIFELSKLRILKIKLRIWVFECISVIWTFNENICI